MNKLRELRVDRGLTQRELGKMAGLSHGAVQRLEAKGSGRPATIKAVADALGVRPSTLLRQQGGDDA